MIKLIIWNEKESIKEKHSQMIDSFIDHLVDATNEYLTVANENNPIGEKEGDVSLDVE